MRISAAKAILVCGTALTALTLPGAALAQDAAPAAEEAAPADIFVTGSRIKKDGFDSPVPVTVVDSALIAALGQTNAADVVKLMPQNVPSQSDANSGVGLSANAGAQFANLRGLNSQRTLTLVNTRRFVPSSTGSQVDLNLIPSVMISRVETVTGGASAAYGSDAVAGVVNVILDNNLTGFKGQIDYGQTGRGDGKTFHGAAAYGLKFGDGRGHIMFGGEYQKNYGIENCSFARDWCAEGWTIVTNEATMQPGGQNLPGSAPGTISGYNVPGSFGFGQPHYVLGRDGALVYNSTNGVIRNLYSAAISSNTQWSNNFPAINPPFAITDQEFNRAGTGVTGFDPGLFGPKSTGSLALGGDNASAYGDQYIQTPLKRWTTYFSGEYELSDAFKFNTELTYAKRTANSRSLTAATRAALAIRPDNAYLPASVRTALNGQSFSFGKDMDEQLDNAVSSDVTVFRGLIGASGSLFGDWTWDAYYQYGHTQRDSSVRYSRHNDAFAMAVDAVQLQPGGPIVCRPLDPTLMARFTQAYRDELNALYAQCKPINLFGVQTLDPAAVAFAWRPQNQEFAYKQHVLSGSVQGTVFEGWGAGPISAAAGIEHRRESGDIVNNRGSITPTGGYSFALGLDYSGKIQVTEGFLETSIPVFRDSAIGDRFDLNGAIRATRNKSTDGLSNRSKTVDVVSWKLGAIFDVTGGLRLRATQSRDIRAAGFAELFVKTAPSEPCTSQGMIRNDNITSTNKLECAALFSGGNFDLVPEKADTTAIGAVYAPTFLRGFQVSLDWYQIKIKDAIANLTAQRVTDLCFQSQLLCDRVTYASPTDITSVIGGQTNVGKMTTRGFDFEASYNLPLDRIWSSGKGALNLRYLLTHQYDLIVQQASVVAPVDYAGQSGPIVDGGDFFPQPKWMWNAIASYSTEKFNMTWTVRHIGKGVLNMDRFGPEDAGYAPTRLNSISTNRVKGATYFNVAMSYKIPFGESVDQNVEVFGTIENLFDKAPAIAPGGGVAAGATAYPTNPVFFDTFGMRWKAGMRLRF